MVTSEISDLVSSPEDPRLQPCLEDLLCPPRGLLLQRRPCRAENPDEVLKVHLTLAFPPSLK